MLLLKLKRTAGYLLKQLREMELSVCFGMEKIEWWEAMIKAGMSHGRGMSMVAGCCRCTSAPMNRPIQWSRRTGCRSQIHQRFPNENAHRNRLRQSARYHRRQWPHAVVFARGSGVVSRVYDGKTGQIGRANLLVNIEHA